MYDLELKYRESDAKSYSLTTLAVYLSELKDMRGKESMDRYVRTISDNCKKFLVSHGQNPPSPTEKEKYYSYLQFVGYVARKVYALGTDGLGFFNYITAPHKFPGHIGMLSQPVWRSVQTDIEKYITAHSSAAEHVAAISKIQDYINLIAYSASREYQCLPQTETIFFDRVCAFDTHVPNTFPSEDEIGNR